ncbi:hypothetical protein KP509_10G053400 [Ceratopteris richardii]|uniref:U-box domain-containing protein n=1 Tax=Ceratopteris richardii TaxID=49495 RepID=A0A8T2TZ26_CERRI|nr:hypothetical protein KP509_10G053400 [Ceratopteris richardii]
MFSPSTSALHGCVFSPTCSCERQQTSSNAELDIFSRLTRLETLPFPSSLPPALSKTACSDSADLLQSIPHRLTWPSSNTLRSPSIMSCIDSWGSVDPSSSLTSLHGKDHDSAVRSSVNTSCNSTSSNCKVKEILQSLRDLGSHPNPHIQVEELSNLLTSLHSICISSPSAVSFCVTEGGVETMLNLLNTNIDCRRSSSVAIQAIEIACRQLLLLVSSSTCGCQAASLNPSYVISTLGGKLLRFSECCTESALSILTILCGNQSDSAIVFCKVASETSIPSKLVVVLQVASQGCTKRRAARLLRLLGQQKRNP